MGKTSNRLLQAFVQEFGDADQAQVETTIKRFGDRIRFSAHTLGGAPRLRDPETGAPIKTHGDVAAFGPGRVLAIWWRGAWQPLPSHDAIASWAIDSCCPTPDGDLVEPDADGSWLRLLGLI